MSGTKPSRTKVQWAAVTVPGRLAGVFMTEGAMKPILALAAVVLLAGCESMSQKVDASRQDRCERADWALVGERDGATGSPLLADRYEYICADMFKPAAYQQGFQKGRARKPAPGA
jgi:hypothetical protein